MAVSEDDKPDEPFDKIKQVEKYIEHFLHLLGMYLFVIERYITDWLVSSSEENPEEVHVTETSRGNESVLYYLHTMFPSSFNQLKSAAVCIENRNDASSQFLFSEDLPLYLIII